MALLAALVAVQTLGVGQQIVVAVGRAHAGFFRGVGRRVFVLVVRRQDRLVAFLVDLGSADGLALFLVTLAFNLFGDGLRDAMDPRTR